MACPSRRARKKVAWILSTLGGGLHRRVAMVIPKFQAPWAENGAVGGFLDQFDLSLVLPLYFLTSRDFPECEKTVKAVDIALLASV